MDAYKPPLKKYLLITSCLKLKKNLYTCFGGGLSLVKKKLSFFNPLVEAKEKFNEGDSCFNIFYT